MPPYTCPLIDHIQAQFEGRNVSFPPVLWNGIVLDDLHSMLEALRLSNADLRIGAEIAHDLEVELDEARERIAELESEVARLRRSV